MDVKDVYAAFAFRDDKMAKVSLFATKRLFCDLYCLRPGQAQKVHSHAENDKVYYLLKGEGKVVVGTEERLLREGEVVLAPAGEPHGIANDSAGEVVCLVFMAPPVETGGRRDEGTRSGAP
jgi:mannose-6-phosphate isomerase-like protein (cupin superfamily)